MTAKQQFCRSQRMQYSEPLREQRRCLHGKQRRRRLWRTRVLLFILKMLQAALMRLICRKSKPAEDLFIRIQSGSTLVTTVGQCSSCLEPLDRYYGER